MDSLVRCVTIATTTRSRKGQHQRINSNHLRFCGGAIPRASTGSPCYMSLSRARLIQTPVRVSAWVVGGYATGRVTKLLPYAAGESACISTYASGTVTGPLPYAAGMSACISTYATGRMTGLLPYAAGSLACTCTRNSDRITHLRG